MPKIPTIEDTLRVIFTGQPTKNLSYYEAGWRMSYLPYAADTDSDETAIIIDEEIYCILYGDHRDALKNKSRSEALEYFKANKALWGASSEHEELEDFRQ